MPICRTDEIEELTRFDDDGTRSPVVNSPGTTRFEPFWSFALLSCASYRPRTVKRKFRSRRRSLRAVQFMAALYDWLNVLLKAM